MKKNLKVIFILIVLFTLSGCTKDYSAISYSKFISFFNDKKDYTIIDKTKLSDDVYKRSYEAGDGKIVFIYLEFDNEKDAIKYINNYKKNKKFKYDKKSNYIILKSKSFNEYKKIIQIDNIIIMGSSKKYFDKFEINKIYKNLGF